MGEHGGAAGADYGFLFPNAVLHACKSHKQITVSHRPLIVVMLYLE